MSRFIWAGQINDDFAASFLRYREDGHDHKMVLKTPGGEAGAFFAVLDAMKADGDWAVLGTGEVGSAGVLLLADGGWARGATPNTRFMVHNALVDAPSDVDAHTLKIWTREAEIWDRQVIEILGRSTKRTSREWRKVLDQGECFYNPTEALKLGLIDRIVK